MATSSHPFMKIGLITAGAGKLVLDSTTHELAPGTLFVIPPRQGHQLVDTPDEQVALLMCCVATDTVRRLGKLPGCAVPALEQCLCRRLPAIAADDCRQVLFTMLELQHREDLAEPGLPLVARLIDLLQFLHLLQRPIVQAGRDPDLQDVIAHVDAHFTSSLRGEDLASSIAMPYRTFTQRFRQQTGCSLGQYQRRLRIAYACTLLRQQLSILDTCRATGYDDLSHFYRQFKQEMGQPPKQWLATRPKD